MKQTKLTNDELGNLAQRKVEEWCASRRIESHAPSRDRKGWDLFVELPQNQEDIETRHGEISCTLQIKGTRTKNNSVNIKLDNWERAIKRPIPFFFVIVTFSGIRVRSVHVIHVDKEWTAKAMRRLRSIPREEYHLIHKKYMSLSWDPKVRLGKDKGKELEEEIRRCIGTDQARYLQRKNAWLQDPDAQTLITLRTPEPPDADYMSAMADFAIGLRDDLPVELVNIEECRFETRKQPADFSPGPGRLKLSELATIPGTLSVSASDFSEQVTIPCEVCGSQSYFPFLPKKHHKIRVITPILSIALQVQSGNATFSFTLPEPDAPAPISTLTGAAKIMQMAIGAPTRGLSIEVWMDSDRLELSYADGLSERIAVSAQSRRLMQTITQLGRIISQAGVSVSAQISVNSLLRQAGSIALVHAAMTGTGDLAVEAIAPHVDNTSPQVSCIRHVEIHVDDQVLHGIVCIEGGAEWTRNEEGCRFRIEQASAYVYRQWIVPESKKRLFDRKSLFGKAVQELEDQGKFVFLDSRDE